MARKDEGGIVRLRGCLGLDQRIGAQSDGGQFYMRDAQNVRVFNGIVYSRTGIVAQGNAPAAPATGMLALFYSTAISRWLCQIDASLYRSPDLITWTLVNTFSSAKTVGMCDFNGEVVICHPADGTYTLTAGFALTLRAATVTGISCAAWQNKVWVTGGSNRVWRSNIGDAHTWTVATDWTDIPELGTAGLTCIGGGNGMDISGRPGLLAFKQDATFRINDSATGAYTLVDGTVGAVTASAVASIAGLVGVLHTSGFHILNDVLGGGYALVSRGAGNNAMVGKPVTQYPPIVSVGVTNETPRSFIFGGGTHTYEYSPEAKTLSPCSSITNGPYANGPDGSLYGRGPSGKVALVFHPTVEDSFSGDPPSIYVKTPWYELNGGRKFRLRRIRVWGAAGMSGGHPNLTLKVYGDYDDVTVKATRTVNVTTNTGSQFNERDCWSLGAMKAVAVEIDAPAAVESIGTGDAGILEEHARGPFLLAGIDFDWLPLGVR